MSRRSLVVVAAGVAGYLHMHPSPQAALDGQWAMLGYCKDCHNDADFTAELSFEHRHPDNVRADPAVWEKVIHKLEIGAMPPRDQPQPPAETRARFLTALTGTLDSAAAAHPYAGATTVHRLNRAEYANAVRDLLGVEADLADLLPSDGGDFGFDNIADVLRTSPFLLDRYLTVALRVSGHGRRQSERGGHGGVVHNSVRHHAGPSSRRHAHRHARRHEGASYRFRPTASTCFPAGCSAGSRKDYSASKGTTGRASS